MRLKNKSMKYILTVLTAIVLVGGGCSAPPVVEPILDLQVIHEEEVEEKQWWELSDEDLATEGSWSMSSGVFAATKPAGWNVQQSDAGGMSAISFMSESPSDFVDVWVWLWVDSEGLPKDTEAFLAERGYLERSSVLEIDGVVFDVYESFGVRSEETIQTRGFVAMVDIEKNILVEIIVPTHGSDDVAVILNSIELNLDSESLEEYNIIP
jgi:hypothetical protein